MALHEDIDHSGLTGIPAAITEITDIETAELDDSLVLAPDGAGGVEFRAEAGGVAEITDIPTAEMDDSLVLAPDGAGGVEFRAEAGGGGSVTDDVAAAAALFNYANFR